MQARTTLVAIALLSATLLPAATLDKLDLALGRTEQTRIATPVYAGAPPLAVGAVTATFDRGAKIVRGSALHGPTYSLAPAIDIPALFARALREEGKAMGFAAPAAPEATWTVSATIRDYHIDSYQSSGWSAALYYGFLELDLELAKPGEESRRYHYRLNDYDAAFSFGTRRGSAENALTRLLVTGAQETLARLNRAVFKAGPAAGIDARLARIVESGVAGRENDLRLVALSGLPAAAPALLQRLPKELEAGRRADLVAALALLAAPEGVDAVVASYRREDEDVRCAAVKSWGAVADENALRHLRELGASDTDEHCKALAVWLLR